MPQGRGARNLRAALRLWHANSLSDLRREDRRKKFNEFSTGCLMRSRVQTHNSIAFVLGALSAAIVLAGCAQMSRPGLSSGTPSLEEPSTLYSLASSSARTTSIYEKSTISFALDRID